MSTIQEQLQERIDVTRSIRDTLNGLDESLEETISVLQEAQATVDRLTAALRESAEAVCSLYCPSTWPTGEKQRHSDKCQRMRAALAPADPEGKT